MVAVDAAVGAPLIVPVAAFNDKPPGRGGAIPYDKEPVPPKPVTGVKLVAGWPLVRMTVASACAAVTAGLMVSEKVLVAVTVLASVTVTVNVVAADVTVGMPVTHAG